MTDFPTFYRFAAPELLKLGPPPLLAAREFQDVFENIAKPALSARMASAGIDYDVRDLETDPGIIILQAAVELDILRRRSIDDAVAQTFLGSAIGAMLDHRAADYGVVRRVVTIADPIAATPDILEDDESLRYRARLAWEALSVAGPVGAYVFHAIDAHPSVFDASAIGPETGLVEPGEVLVVVQGRSETGVPSDGIIDAVAARLDAYEVVYASGLSAVRPVRNGQAVRPLGARVTVAAARALYFDVSATLYVSAAGDREAVRLAALSNLQAYLESRRRVGRTVPHSGLVAALHLTSPSGVPVVEEVEVDAGDIVPDHMEIAVVRRIELRIVPR